MGSSASSLRPEVLADLTESTDFTACELNDLYRQYRHDCAHKGSRSTLRMKLAEFKSIYHGIFPDGDADKFAEHVFRTYDKNQDGFINFKEFITMLNVQLKGSYEDKLNWLFDLYDVDRTNDITYDEALDVVTVLFDLRSGMIPVEDKVSPGDLTDYIFKRADKENDGKVDRKAFLEAAKESKTLRALLEATAKCASQPYIMRKERSGSFGRRRSVGSEPHVTDNSRIRSSSVDSNSNRERSESSKIDKSGVRERKHSAGNTERNEVNKIK